MASFNNLFSKEKDVVNEITRSDGTSVQTGDTIQVDGDGTGLEGRSHNVAPDTIPYWSGTNYENSALIWRPADRNLDIGIPRVTPATGVYDNSSGTVMRFQFNNLGNGSTNSGFQKTYTSAGDFGISTQLALITIFSASAGNGSGSYDDPDMVEFYDGWRALAEDTATAHSTTYNPSDINTWITLDEPVALRLQQGTDPDNYVEFTIGGVSALDQGNLFAMRFIFKPTSAAGTINTGIASSNGLAKLDFPADYTASPNQYFTFGPGASVTLANNSNDTVVFGIEQLTTATITGDLEVTGTINGPFIGAIRNINPVAGTGGIAQDFRIWAGTQTEFDTQFDNDGSGTVSGTPAASDGSVVYIITNN